MNDDDFRPYQETQNATRSMAIERPVAWSITAGLVLGVFGWVVFGSLLAGALGGTLTALGNWILWRPNGKFRQRTRYQR